MCDVAHKLRFDLRFCVPLCRHRVDNACFRSVFRFVSSGLSSRLSLILRTNVRMGALGIRTYNLVEFWLTILFAALFFLQASPPHEAYLLYSIQLDLL